MFEYAGENNAMKQLQSTFPIIYGMYMLKNRCDMEKI